MSTGQSNVGDWAAGIVAGEIARADRTLRRQRSKPRSAKRVHDARRALARLLSTLQDFQSCINGTQQLLERITALHKRLGRIRDADVHLKRLRAYRKSATREERLAIREMSRAIRKRRRKARRKLAILLEIPRVEPVA
ncbi:MAG: CHAD domain-containing protein [Vulcanimicrobiaceae bacterium]